jgi:hypothetical protein
MNPWRYIFIMIILAAIIICGYISNWYTRKKYESAFEVHGDWITASKVTFNLPFIVVIYEYYKDDKTEYSTLTRDKYLSFFGYLYESDKPKLRCDSLNLDICPSMWNEIEQHYP